MSSRALAVFKHAPSDRRAGRKLPFDTELCLRRDLDNPAEKPQPASVIELSPLGAILAAPGNPATPGEQFVLCVSAAGHRLLDIPVEVLHVETDADGAGRISCEFRPVLPRRQFLLLRRLALPAAVSSVLDLRRRPESAA